MLQGLLLGVNANLNHILVELDWIEMSCDSMGKVLDNFGTCSTHTFPIPLSTKDFAALLLISYTKLLLLLITRAAILGCVDLS